MNQPFNQPRSSRWPEVNRRRPENQPFAEWAEEQTRLVHENHGPWVEAQSGIADLERELAADADRRARLRRGHTEGWKQGEPGE